MSAIAFLRQMLDAGLSLKDALTAAEAFEQSSPGFDSVLSVQRQVRKPQNNEAVWVYVMAVDHPNAAPLVKIGISQHPETRLATLERDHRRNLFLAATFGPFSRSRALDIEKSAHFTLNDLNESGEWFWCPVSLAEDTIRRFAFGEVRQ